MSERRNHDELGPFPATQWSLVDVVRQGDPQAKRRALDALLNRYLPALRAYLLIERRIDPEPASDLLQSFVADKIVERDLFARAERSRGKFRTFLLTALQRFVIDAARRRDGGRPTGPHLDDVAPTAAAAAAAAAAAPSRAFDQEWAAQVIGNTLARMEANCRQWGRLDLWEIFKGRVVAPAFDNAAPTPYEQIAPRFGFASNEQASNALVTAKRLFARLLREVIAEYAGDRADVEEELRDLRAALATAPGPGRELMSLT
jgi:RNA polymerase sigma-70 factor (ECF subfamily)